MPEKTALEHGLHPVLDGVADDDGEQEPNRRHGRARLQGGEHREGHRRGGGERVERVHDPRRRLAHLERQPEHRRREALQHVAAELEVLRPAARRRRSGRPSRSPGRAGGAPLSRRRRRAARPRRRGPRRLCARPSSDTPSDAQNVSSTSERSSSAQCAAVSHLLGDGPRERLVDDGAERAGDGRARRHERRPERAAIRARASALRLAHRREPRGAHEAREEAEPSRRLRRLGARPRAGPDAPSAARTSASGEPSESEASW